MTETQLTTAVPLPPGPVPGSPLQIMLPPPLQEVMQQFPDVVKRLAALETKPVLPQTPVALVATCAYLAGVVTMSLLVFLWHSGSLIAGWLQ